MLRSAGVVGFIAIVASTGVYFAQRPTVARGEVLAADLVKTNPTVKSLECDEQVPIGLAGAKFNCAAEFKNGDRVRYVFALDRNGTIAVVEQSKQSAPQVKKTSDPWGD